MKTEYKNKILELKMLPVNISKSFDGKYKSAWLFLIEDITL